MSIRNRMASPKKSVDRGTQINEKLYREEKGYRADCLN